jgi:hypothetical protein
MLDLFNGTEMEIIFSILAVEKMEDTSTVFTRELEHAF